MRIPPWIKWIGFGIVVFITLIGLVFAVENYRGRRAWQKCRAELEAAGESLDWRTFVRPEVPDDQNFAQTPLLAPLQDYTLDPQTRQAVWRDPKAVESTQALFSWCGLSTLRPHCWRKGEFVDFAAWQKVLRDPTHANNPDLQALQATPLGNPVEDVRFLLARNAAELEEIRAASHRPHSRFKIHYEEGLDAQLSQLSVLRNFARAFVTKALVELQSGHPELAADDVRVSLSLAGAAGGEPLLIAHLVNIAILDVSLEPLWEGMARHQWTDTQLQEFQKRLAAVNIPADTLRACRGERALGLLAIEQLQSDLRGIQAVSEETGPLRYMPSGWFHQNLNSMARLYQELVINAYDATNRRIDLALGSRLDQREHTLFRSKSPYTLFVRMLFPAIGKVTAKAARAQAALDMATLACALERHFLAQGDYPPTLDALVPRFIDHIPPDPVNQQPFHYRLEAQGRFVLYSVGLNLKDDQGTVAVEKNGNPAPDRAEGDWVWRTPAG